MSNHQTAGSTVDQSTDRLNDLIIESMQDIKASRIVKLDLRSLDDRPADYFIICEAESSVQVKAIANNVYKRVKNEMAMMPGHFEGKDGATWILVDFFDTVVHVFNPETRDYYGLEELWGDAGVTEYEDL